MGLIRFILALSIFEHHSDIMGYDFLNGSGAVQCFFILSGFYMALILCGRYADKPLQLFYANRLFRLFPSYLVVSLLSLTFLLAFDAHPFMDADYFRDMYGRVSAESFTLALSGLTTIGQDLLFITGVDHYGDFYWAAGVNGAVKAFTFALIPQAWSLSVELLFYAAAPFMVRSGPRRILLIGIAALVLRLTLNHLGPAYADFAYRFMPAHLPLFMTGALAYYVFERINKYRLTSRIGTAAIPIVVVAMLAYGAAPKDWRFPALAFIFASALPFIFTATKDNRIDRFLGDLSYPLYLVHMLCISIWEICPETVPAFALIAGTGVATLALHYFVDRPVDRWRHSLTEPALILAAPCAPDNGAQGNGAPALAIVPHKKTLPKTH